MANKGFQTLTKRFQSTLIFSYSYIIFAVMSAKTKNSISLFFLVVVKGKGAKKELTWGLHLQ